MRKLGILTFFCLILIAAFPTNAASKVTPGSKCPKAGITQIFAGKKFTCIKLGSKLYWNNGKKIGSVPSAIPTIPDKVIPSPTPTTQSTYSPAPTPSSSASQKPSPTPSVVAHPNKTKPVINVKLTAGFKSYTVSYDFQEGDEHVDLIIFESTTGNFSGEQYIVYVGNAKKVDINTSDFQPRWVVIRTRDQWSDLNISEVKAGPISPKNPDPDTSTAPPPPTNVQVQCKIEGATSWSAC